MQQIKRALYKALYDLAGSPADEVAGHVQRLYAAPASWRGAAPLDEMSGVEAITERVWQPLLTAMPDLERRDVIFVGGVHQGHAMIAAAGHYCGTFVRDWLGIPATGRTAYLRYGEVYRVEDGRVTQSTCLWDILDLMRQAGVWPLTASLGEEQMWPAPLTGDGIVLRETDPAQSAASLAQTLAMHKTLGDYDDTRGLGRQGLLDMEQKIHWHPKMMWYGPAGIGTTRGLAGFVDGHQLPFRIAFPNRRGGNHYIRIGDGPYSVTGGWPSIHTKHLGGGFLGLGPTGRDITMRVMDFYLHHEGLIRENWVPIDMIDILRQMGVDVMERMAALHPGRVRRR